MSVNIPAVQYNESPAGKPMLASPAGGERIHTRAAVPFKARIHNEWFRVENIGLGGFAIKHPLPSDVTTLPSIVELSLFLNDVTLSISAPVREVWNNSEGVRSFEFLSLTRHQAALLNRLVEDYLARQVTVVDNLIEQPAAEGKGGVATRVVTPRRSVPWLALGLSAALCVLALLCAVPLFSVSSTVAAVAVSGTSLRAPATGVLEGPGLTVGSAVRTGDVMFSIRTPLLVTQTAAAVADQDRTAMALRDQRAQSRQVNDLATHLVAVSQAKTESIKARIATIDSQIGTANALLERMQSLVEQGFAAKIQVDNQKIAVDTLRRNREEAALELIAAESETSLSAGGSLRTDFTTSVQTRATMRARVNEADAAVRANESNINALDNATRILSPCDCVVHAVMATPGDVVEAGTLVYALRPRSTAPEVDALFSAQRGHELRSGATAVIALPDRWVRGRVRSMSYLAGNSARIGLPQKVDAATGDSGQQLATATIVPDEPIDAALIGSPVTAYIASNPFGSLGAHIATLFH